MPKQLGDQLIKAGERWEGMLEDARFEVMIINHSKEDAVIRCVQMLKRGRKPGKKAHDGTIQ